MTYIVQGNIELPPITIIDWTEQDENGNDVDWGSSQWVFAATFLNEVGKTTSDSTVYGKTGQVQVRFSTSSDIPELLPGEYIMRVTATRGTDSRQFEYRRNVVIRPTF